MFADNTYEGLKCVLDVGNEGRLLFFPPTCVVLDMQTLSIDLRAPHLDQNGKGWRGYGYERLV